MSPFVKGQKPPVRKSLQSKASTQEEVAPMEVAQERPERDVPVNRANRPERTPLGARNRLTFKGQDPNYVYRWINDQDERLNNALEASYEFVCGSHQLAGDKRLESTPLDGRISKPAGNGIRTYLMRIRKDLYEQDQKAKMAAVDASEATMKPNAAKGQYGTGLTND